MTDLDVGYTVSWKLATYLHVRACVRVFVILLVSHIMGIIRVEMSENRLLRRTFGPK